MLVTIIVPLSLVALIISAVTPGLQSRQDVEISADCAVNSTFPPKVTQWCSLITAQANENDLHPDLLASLIWLESGGSPDAYSHSGAVGLMQVMPSDGLAENFHCPNGPCFKNRPATAELLDPDYNVSYGARLLSGLVEDSGGDLREALRRYGPMDVGYRYADNVLAIFNQYGNP